MLGSQTKSEILIAGKDKNAGHMNHCPSNSRFGVYNDQSLCRSY